jgi:hypothetical protein
LKALFSVSIDLYRREQLPVIRHLARNGFEVSVLIGYRGSAAWAFADECRRRGIAVYCAPDSLAYGAFDPPPDGEPGETAFAAAAPGGRTAARLRQLGRRLPALLRVPLRALIHGLRARRFSSRVLREIAPDLVFSGPFFSCGKIDDGIARACSDHGIPHFCLPFGPYLGERSKVRARLNQLRTGMIDDRLRADTTPARKALAALRPDWVREVDGLRLFPHQPLVMLGVWAAGLLPRRPWSHPSDSFDRVFTESEFSRRLLVDGGFAPERVVVVGTPMLDDVIEHLSQPGWAAGMLAQLGLAPGERFVLVNVEPSREHRYATPRQHWGNFEVLMDALGCLTMKKVLSLHPLCALDDYLFVEKRPGYRVSRDHRIVDIYPHCARVVSFPCSTNQFSLVFRKPLLIYDFFGMTKVREGEENHFRIPGAAYARDRDELRAALEAWDAEPAPQTPAAVRQLRSASELIRRFVVEYLQSRLSSASAASL